MTRTTRLLILGAALIISPTLITLAQLNVAPPSSEPAAPEPTSRPTVATQASTLPSAKSVLEGLINDRGNNTSNVRPVQPAIDTNPTLTPAAPANAPKTPVAMRRIEGNPLEGVGRLTKDEKTNSYIFVFDSDGRQMTDPPIALLPNRLLESMEQTNAKSPRGAKFKIAGELTEFKGRNYLLLRSVSELKDLNQGLGG